MRARRYGPFRQPLDLIESPEGLTGRHDHPFGVCRNESVKAFEVVGGEGCREGFQRIGSYLGIHRVFTCGVYPGLSMARVQCGRLDASARRWPILFARPSTIGAGRIQNLSMSGAWIGVHMDLPVLAHVMVVFESAPVGQRDKPSVGAYVTCTSEEGIGIEWYELDPLCL